MKKINLITTVIIALLVSSMLGFVEAQDSSEQTAEIPVGKREVPILEQTPEVPVGKGGEPVLYLREIVFKGKGFIENEGDARLLSITLLKESTKDKGKKIGKGVGVPEFVETEITGKAYIGSPDISYAVKGILVKERVRLEFHKIYEIHKNGDAGRVSIVRPVITFEGTLKEFKTVKVLKGDLKNFDGEEWKLVAFSGFGVIVPKPPKEPERPLPGPIEEEKLKIEAEKERSFIVTERASKTGVISKNEVISLEKDEAGEGEEKIYIQSVGVYKPKILDFIPNPFAKKVVEVRVTEGEKIETLRIKEQETATVRDYKIKATNFEKEKIEFEISK